MKVGIRSITLINCLFVEWELRSLFHHVLPSQNMTEIYLCEYLTCQDYCARLMGPPERLPKQHKQYYRPHEKTTKATSEAIKQPQTRPRVISILFRLERFSDCKRNRQSVPSVSTATSRQATKSRPHQPTSSSTTQSRLSDTKQQTQTDLAPQTLSISESRRAIYLFLPEPQEANS
ncbi:hypothetical protein BU16DRAFT_363396 [Lophium mytilinum]|uniref:Uncharacterized protein n=1 Tax=Lophium mytilinum TaxID=390894 RepID=A0A6A6QUC3_9PEZI|nr:hypothetical protein BU16DRAFT_363396 [Lophium mytilinum]